MPVYRVHIVEQNKLLATVTSKEQAIGDADSLAGVDGLSGAIEVHEFAESDTDFRYPRLVYTARA